MTQRKNPMFVRPNTLTQSDSGFASSEVVQAAPAILLSVSAMNKSSGVLYVLLFDAGAVPAGGSAPSLAPLSVPAGGSVSLSFNEVSGLGLTGVSLTSGLTWAASSTAGTLTLDSTNSLWVTTRFA